MVHKLLLYNHLLAVHQVYKTFSLIAAMQPRIKVAIIVVVLICCNSI